MITECCSAEFVEDSNMCSDCGEHAIELDDDKDCCMARSVGFPEHCHCTKKTRYEDDEDAAYENWRDGLDEDERLNDE